MVRSPTTPPLTAEPDTPAGGQSVPVQLAGLVTTGGVVGEVEVTRAVLYLKDGRRLVLDLPTTVPAAPPAKDWAKTKTGRAILDVLATEGRPLKAASIAKLMGGEYSGSFRQTLKGLATQGEVSHDDGEYSLPE